MKSATARKLGVGSAAGYGLRWIGRGIIKPVPGLGQTVGAPWGATLSAAGTSALGGAACYDLGQKSDGAQVEAQAIGDVCAQARSLSALRKHQAAS